MRWLTAIDADSNLVGTTGSPKGVLRSAGGHAVGLNFSAKYLLGLEGPGDVLFCSSDIGWIVGHSYILYTPLLAGATTILFEGKPNLPDVGIFWRIIEKHKVKILYTAPTALRAIRKDDPDALLFSDVGRRGGLKSLRGLFLAGERSEPSIVSIFQGLLSQYAAPGALVVDNWWSSESGSPMTGLALSPSAGLESHEPKSSEHSLCRPLPLRPGSAGKPMPGFDVRIVNDEGVEIPRGNMGNVVLSWPLAPTGFTTLFKDADRFYRGYLKRFNGKWIDTGDAGIIDEEGYVHIMARTDDIINVAAHRFSTGAIEQSILSHDAVGEVSVVGIPDQLKGHLPFAFIQLSPHSPLAESTDMFFPANPPRQLFNEINTLVRTQIGAIASLGGIIIAKPGQVIIPKTRSGKSLRLVLRELMENAVQGNFSKKINVPPTVEDPRVVENARVRVIEWFDEKGGLQARAKL